MCIVIHIFSRQATSKSENTPPDDYNPGENIASEDHPKNISGNLRDVAHNLHMAVQGTVIYSLFLYMYEQRICKIVKLFEKYDNQTATCGILHAPRHICLTIRLIINGVPACVN